MIETSSDLEMLATSSSLSESLAREEYQPVEMNPIVASMASMVITTTSSTSVKPLKGTSHLLFRRAIRKKVKTNTF